MKDKILIVEDDIYVQKNLARILELDNYEVKTAANGAIALNELLSYSPDLIISDIMMPIMNGYQFYENIQKNEKLRQVPFIFLSGRGGKVDIREGKKIGVDDYIIKPYEAEDILITVRSRLNKYKTIRNEIVVEVETLKKEILYKLTHELRTPIAVVKGVSELITTSKEMDIAELHQMAKILNHGSLRLERLLNKFLTVKQLADAHKKSDIHDLYANQLFELPLSFKEKIVDSLQYIIEQHQVELNTNWDDRNNNRYPVYNEHLKNLLIEILENAIKFSSKGQHVDFNITNTQEALEIEIQDYGIGVPEQEIPLIFEKFYQYDRKSMEQQGSGLGLTIVKYIVDLYKGDINFKSKPGEGSIVNIRFNRYSNN